MKKNKQVEYAQPGSAEYVKGKWALAIQQYLSYISEDTGISMEELLLRVNAELSTEEEVTGLLFNVTNDKAYEMFVYKTIDDEHSPVNATLADVTVVAGLIREAREDIAA